MEGDDDSVWVPITIHDSELHAPQYNTMHAPTGSEIAAGFLIQIKGGFAAVPSTFVSHNSSPHKSTPCMDSSHNLAFFFVEET